MTTYSVPAGPRSVVHASFFCNVMSGRNHHPCSGTCDRHFTDEYGFQDGYCKRRCECTCHTLYVVNFIREILEHRVPSLTLAAVRAHLTGEGDARLEDDGLHWGPVLTTDEVLQANARQDARPDQDWSWGWRAARTEEPEDEWLWT